MGWSRKLLKQKELLFELAKKWTQTIRKTNLK